MRSWRVLSGSVPGVAHLRQGGDCQDAFATRQTDDGVLFAAVADGASSAELSALGAHLAVHLAIRIAAEQWEGPTARAPEDYKGWQTYLGHIHAQLTKRFVTVVQSAVQAAAGQLGGGGFGDSTGDFYTTLTLAVARPPWIGVLSIGDGFVVVREHEARYHLFCVAEERAERASETYFVNSYDPRPVYCVGRLPDLTGIAVGTDGVGDVCLERADAEPRKPMAGFFSPVFGWAEDPDVDDSMLVRLFASPKMCGSTEDDKSLIAAVRR